MRATPPMPTLSNEELALQLWESMFGSVTMAKGGIYTITYKQFTERFINAIATQNTALLKEVADTVIGTDEPDSVSQYAPIEQMGLPLQAIVFRNQLRATQRSKLTAIGEQL